MYKYLILISFFIMGCNKENIELEINDDSIKTLSFNVIANTASWSIVETLQTTDTIYSLSGTEETKFQYSLKKDEFISLTSHGLNCVVILEVCINGKDTTIYYDEDNDHKIEFYDIN